MNKDKKKSQNVLIESLVKNCLNEDYSPEQIIDRAKLQGINSVSTERIYQYIWSNKKQGGVLYLKLRRKGRKYRKRGLKNNAMGIIKGRVDISERPVIVDQKQKFGDFEIDAVIGKNHKGVLLTINDRVSSLVWVKKLKSKNAEELVQETIKILMLYKEQVHTITSDNGKEFAEHKKISVALNIDFYFAQP